MAPKAEFSFRSFRWFLALLFAVKEVNETPGALPNLTLGLRVLDTCSDAREALRGASFLITGGPEGAFSHRCWGLHYRLAAMLSDAGTESALSVANVIGIYNYPQISYFTPPLQFSNRVLFPSSLSVAPALSSHAKGLVQLIQTFGWTWVGVLSEVGGVSTVAQTFIEELKTTRVCLAFWENVPSALIDISNVASVIKRSTANVVVVFSLESYLNPVLMDLALSVDTKAKIWIFTEGWSTSPRLVNPKLSHFLHGALGVAPRNGAAPGLKEFVLGLQPNQIPENQFLMEFWQLAFSCRWGITNNESLYWTISTNTSSVFSDYHFSSTTSLQFTVSTSALNSSDTLPICTGLEDPASLQIFSDINSLRVTYNVYKAVRMVAQALKDMATCKDREDGSIDRGSCVDMQHFQPWQFLYHLRRVHLKGNVDDDLYFDSLGNAPAVYDIINWQEEPSGLASLVIVGMYESGVLQRQNIIIDYASIKWAKGIKQPPVSKCSENCPPGFWKSPQQGQPPCCFNCITCAAGEISNQTDSLDCFLCSDDKWPNLARDQCLPREVELLSFTDPLGISLGTTSILGSALPGFVLFLFIKNRDTPLVRANNQALSFLLLAGLTFCFLCPVLLLLPPGNQMCLIRQAPFGVLFTLCVSCLLAKTFIVVLAFRANQPGGCIRVLMGPRWPILIALSCTFLQFIFCLFWISVDPPFLEHDVKSQLGKVIIQCNDGLGFWLMLCYLGLLSAICFLVAFLARKLPGAFNEATHITFSMLLFLIVWVSFVPPYLSTQGKLSVATEIFAILSSSAGLLFCIFFPKCYIILLQPQLNTRELVSGHQRKHSRKNFRSSRNEMESKYSART
ncbi:extracellular calcium-sensing receptor-like [Pelobates fuscus]|uniref:extracellular calcium-sensing receptor-like n=1 Tax=Pelobates fuscus TaxID=191477 RepID=UPI002FE44A20